MERKNICLWCAKQLPPQKHMGAKRKTCDASCRQLFYLTKKALSNKSLANRVQKAIRGG